MQRNVRTRIVACLLICLITVGLSLQFGSTLLGIQFLYQPGIERDLMLNIRMPRILVAILCGGALAGAGVLTQGLFRNALASPSVIGTTAGGSAAAAMAFYFGATSWHWLAVPVSASIGAALAMLLLLSLCHWSRLLIVSNLLLAGFALNAFLGAVTSFVVSLVLEDYQKFPALMFWLMGGLSAKTWTHVVMGLVPISFGFWGAWRLCGHLDLLAMGEEVAQTLSINIHQLRKRIIIIVAILVGGAVSVAGAITFVGLIAPHITRLLLGPHHKPLLIGSTINGITLVVLADLIARTIRAPLELHVGVLVALIGGPFFIWLLVSEQKGQFS